MQASHEAKQLQLEQQWALKHNQTAQAVGEALVKRLVAANGAVHAGFCNNFDTPAVLAALTELVGDANKYLAKFGATPAALLLRKVAVFVTRILKVLGVIEGPDDIGFPLGGAMGGAFACLLL